MQKSTFPPSTSPQLSISHFICFNFFCIYQNRFMSPCLGDIQMLNICDVDIFDQNPSSPDSDIDTQCDIILLLNFYFQFHPKFSIDAISLLKCLYVHFCNCCFFIVYYIIIKLKTVEANVESGMLRNAEFKFAGGTSIKIHSTIVKEFDKRFFNLKPRNTIR